MLFFDSVLARSHRCLCALDPRPRKWWYSASIALIHVLDLFCGFFLSPFDLIDAEHINPESSLSSRLTQMHDRLREGSLVAPVTMLLAMMGISSFVSPRMLKYASETGFQFGD